MPWVKKFIFTRTANILFGIVTSAWWAMFAWLHLRAYSTTGDFAYLFFCVIESTQAIIFLLRKMPTNVSTDLFDWVVAGGGTFAPLFLRPGGFVLWSHGNILVIGAVIFQVLALLTLNTSFAIVAANRGIKMKGVYRAMRHPMYTSYIFSDLGYLLFNSTPFNAAIVLFTFICLALRIEAEEKLLSGDPEYREYKMLTKWRLLPFIY
jgi:protein-S-isoprenylcysteine O-methyltransferase Ste14